MAQENTYEEDFNAMFGGTKKDKDPQNTEYREEEPENKQQDTELSGEVEDKPSEQSDKSKDNSSTEAKDNEEVDYDKLLESTPDDVREQVRLLIQKDKTNRGRLSALDKKLVRAEELYQNALRNNEQLEQQRAQGNQHSPEAAQQEEKPEGNDEGRKKTPDMSPELRAIKEKHPNLYKALQEMTKAEAQAVAEKALEDVNSKIKPMEDAQRQEGYKKEAEALDAKAARLFDTENTGVGVREVVQSEEFSHWFRGQSIEIQNMYKHAETAEQAMAVLSKFSLESDYLDKIRKNLDNDSESQTEESNKPEKSKGDELRKKREATKKAAVAPSNKEAPTGSDAPVNYDKLFDHYWGDNGVHRTQRRLTTI